MSESRTFPLAAVLSVTTGKLLCDIGEVYGILNFLTGDELYTHQLPRASRECEPYILKHYPELASIDASAVSGENWREFLAKSIESHGPALTLEPMADGTHEYRNPITELEETVGTDKVIPLVVEPEPDDEGDEWKRGS